MLPVPAEFYDEAYFTAGTKSNYHPYGPGDWADALTTLIVRNLHPISVLDVGCATGLMVKRLSHYADAYGFDISQWAVAKAASPYVWQGDASQEGAWVAVDLILSTEVGEHLTDDQATDMMCLARQYGERALMLIATHHADGDSDASHINFHPLEWWEDLAEACGWHVDDASAFNDSPIARKMGWSGRFLLLGK